VDPGAPLRADAHLAGKVRRHPPPLLLLLLLLLLMLLLSIHSWCWQLLFKKNDALLHGLYSEYCGASNRHPAYVPGCSAVCERKFIAVFCLSPPTLQGLGSAREREALQALFEMGR